MTSVLVVSIKTRYLLLRVDFFAAAAVPAVRGSDEVLEAAVDAEVSEVSEEHEDMASSEVEEDPDEYKEEREDATLEREEERLCPKAVR